MHQRSDSSAEADECVQCPTGSYNMERSFWHPNEAQSGTSPPPVGFCLLCPQGADCKGGNDVVSQEGYYALRRIEQLSRGPGESIMNLTVVEAYPCPSGACSSNNSCNGGREELLCSFCPRGQSWGGNKCEKCDEIALRVVAGISAFVVCVVLFLSGWRYAWPHNWVHNLLDQACSWIGTFSSGEGDALGKFKTFRRMLQKILRRFQRIMTRISSNADLGIQGSKILLGNFQVTLVHCLCSL